MPGQDKIENGTAMARVIRLTFAATIGMIACSPPLAAREPDAKATASAISQVIDCRAQSDVEKRLSCFDAASDALADAFGSPKDTGAVQEGLVALAATQPGKAREEKKEPEAIDTITEVISAVTTNSAGRYVLTLAGGSRWAQRDDIFVNRPQPGQTATINRGIVGSYVAKIGDGRSFRVQRLPD